MTISHEHSTNSHATDDLPGCDDYIECSVHANDDSTSVEAASTSKQRVSAGAVQNVRKANFILRPRDDHECSDVILQRSYVASESGCIRRNEKQRRRHDTDINVEMAGRA